MAKKKIKKFETETRKSNGMLKHIRDGKNKKMNTGASKMVAKRAEKGETVKETAVRFAITLSIIQLSVVVISFT